MEDFEKIKKEKMQSQNKAQEKAKNDKKGAKNKKTLKVSIVAVSAIALVSVGIFVGSRFSKNTTSINNNGTQNSNIATSNQVQELVTDAFAYSGTTKDSNNTSVSYKIPKININSSDATKINNEIDEEITSKVKEMITEINEGHTPATNKISYKFYINDDILSVITKSDYANDVELYLVYNININTGKSISNEELINKKGMTKEQFEEKLTSAVKSEFVNIYGYVNNWMNTQEYNNTISASNCDANAQMIYLDESGNINVVAKIYSFAGADSYYYIINLE